MQHVLYDYIHFYQYKQSCFGVYCGCDIYITEKDDPDRQFWLLVHVPCFYLLQFCYILGVLGLQGIQGSSKGNAGWIVARRTWWRRLILIGLTIAAVTAVIIKLSVARRSAILM